MVDATVIRMPYDSMTDDQARLGRNIGHEGPARSPGSIAIDLNYGIYVGIKRM